MAIINSVNLLKLAMGVIPPRTILYLEFDSMTVNEAGEFVPSYKDPEEVKAIIQSETEAVYPEHGISKQKLHKTIYVNKQIKATNNQRASDLFYFDNEYWRVTSVTDWSQYNGWSLCTVSLADHNEVNA